MKYTLKQAKTLQQIANIVDAEIVGDPLSGGGSIFDISTIDAAGSGSITFLANPIYKKYLPTTQAAAVILSKEDAQDCPVPVLLTKNPRLSLAKLLQLCESNEKTESNIHPSAVIADDVEIGEKVTIGPNVVIGRECKIGDGCELKANVSIYDRVQIGSNTTIHSNSVIGSDGFGYALDDDQNWVKMPHLGGVLIGENVEIGSNTSIDRGVFENTVIGDNVIIDNLVQIGHNVTIGAHTAIAGCAGVAGSTSIGSRCLIGGASCIGGHLQIADNVHITATSAVNSSIKDAGIYSSGLPARENSKWRRNVARFMSLDKMAKRIAQLEKGLVSADE